MQVDACTLLTETRQDADGSPVDGLSEATPLQRHITAQRRGLHLEEAKAMCPEGREASDSYHQTAYQGIDHV